MGRYPYKGTTPKMALRNETAQEFADGIRKTWDEVGSALKMAKENMKQFYDRKRTEAVEYKKGDKVWLEKTNLSTDQPMKKLNDKYFGPFKVIKKVGASSYKLQIPHMWKSIHPVFNEAVLTPYHKPQFLMQPQDRRPPPVLEGNEPEWEVEKVVNSRKYHRGFQYKVHWKGYDTHKQIWEPACNLKNADKAIHNFYQQYPTKPKPPALARIEVPMSQFSSHLFRPMSLPDTKPLDVTLPSAALIKQLWRRMELAP